MGVSFSLSTVERLEHEQVRVLDDPQTRCTDRLRQLPALLDPADGRNRRGLGKTFPWYFRAFDWDSARPPTVADCASPKDVLAGVQALERELERKPKRYPAKWKLWVQQGDGSEAPCHQLTGIYRGKRCSLFTDEQGAWAVEVDSPMRYPIHYPLSDLGHVSVEAEAGMPPVSVRIESLTPLAAHQELFADMKRVCIQALQKNALVLPGFV